MSSAVRTYVVPVAPRMAVPVGLLLYGARQALASGGFAPGRRSPAVEKVLGPVRRWLQDFF